MLPIVPKELTNKIRFKNNDIYIKESIKLTDEEQKIFEKFREYLRKANKDRLS